MTGGGNEIEEGMDSVITETSLTSNSGLFGENIIILAFKVADNLLKSGSGIKTVLVTLRNQDVKKTYAESLSILSPNPGVSTIVSAMRTPSSSSSVKPGELATRFRPESHDELTDVDWLDFYALFDVGSLWVIRDLVIEDLRFAERVHEGGTSGPRGTYGKTHKFSAFLQS
jgi:hypothetical protein